MHYSAIKKYDIANGDGVRLSLFVSGCTNNCKGCFNSETWDFFYGKEFTNEVLSEMLEFLKKDYIKGLSLLGGDPLHPRNVPTVLHILREYHKAILNKDAWLWTGYTYEELIERNDKDTNEILKNLDILIEGRFVEALKVPNLKYRGSTNQRVLKMKDGKPVDLVNWMSLVNIEK